jgi:hypothetical protein
MPVNILLTFIVGSIFGWILLLLTRPPPHLRGLTVGFCAAGNFEYSIHMIAKSLFIT